MSKHHILLIDVGNSRVKWALAEKQTILAGGQWQHQPGADLCLSQIAVNELPSQIIVSNVAGAHFRQEIIDWAMVNYSLDVEFVMASTEAHGVRNAYLHPEELGSDRWLTLIAAHALYQGEICVVDAGSAITIDLLNANGEHVGGYILPGFAGMGQALSGNTTLNPLAAEFSVAAELQPGTSTKQCIANGTLIAICSAIEGIVKHFAEDKCKKIQCVLTGGDATRLSDKLHIPHLVEPALVLKGMTIVATSLAQSS